MSARVVQRYMQRAKVPGPQFLRLAPGAAWFFIAFSLTYLVWVVGTKWTAPAGLTTLYQTTIDGEVHAAWGLSYEGAFGLLLAIVQLGVLVAAVLMSLLKTDKWRRVGHGVLVAWAALWMMGLLNLAVEDGTLGTLLQTGVVSLLLGATLYRAVLAFPRRPEMLTVTNVSSSGRVADVTRRYRGGRLARRLGQAASATYRKVKGISTNLALMVGRKMRWRATPAPSDVA